MTPLNNLADVARTQAKLNAALGAGSVLGEIGERVAARVTGSQRISGTGNDLMRPAPAGWQRPAVQGIVGTPSGATRVAAEDMIDERARARYAKWVGRGDRQLGEVKARQLDRRYCPESQLLDTRGGGASSQFCPFVDFYVFVVFALDGSIAKCLEVPRSDLLEYVASDVGRGGKWNYKISIGLWTDIGVDCTAAAQEAMRELKAAPESKGRNE